MEVAQPSRQLTNLLNANTKSC